MQSVSSRIWTRLTVSISCDDNHYTTGTSTSIPATGRYCLATLMSSDRTKQICLWMTIDIYIYILYIYIYIYRERDRFDTFLTFLSDDCVHHMKLHVMDFMFPSIHDWYIFRFSFFIIINIIFLMVYLCVCMQVCMWGVYIYIYMCVCVCVCV